METRPGPFPVCRQGDVSHHQDQLGAAQGLWGTLSLFRLRDLREDVPLRGLAALPRRQVELFCAQTPKTCKNFLALAASGAPTCLVIGNGTLHRFLRTVGSHLLEELP